MSGNVPMPPYTRILEHQVAGHFHAKSKSLLGALQDVRSGVILKPLQASPNSPKELGFYNNLFSDNNTNVDDLMLRHLVPQFLGVLQFNDLQYIRLENICIPFKFPCIADIKIGRRTFGPDSTMAKRLREISKCPIAFQVGFQIVGMKLYQPIRRRYIYHDRLCCRSFLANEIIHGLAWLFGISHYSFPPHSRTFVKLVIGKLNNIRDYFVQQRIYNMYGVSVLIVYEGFHNRLYKKIPKNSQYRTNCERHDTESTWLNHSVSF
ncbi:hypothetical protein GJ496_007479 [Pomphorhynchus laevis]|nr:hypothetical protein GJ496_007479 [Pomphorhynchus laevis]